MEMKATAVFQLWKYSTCWLLRSRTNIYSNFLACVIPSVNWINSIFLCKGRIKICY